MAYVLDIKATRGNVSTDKHVRGTGSEELVVASPSHEGYLAMQPYRAPALPSQQMLSRAA